jgi:hypothetical protein
LFREDQRTGFPAYKLKRQMTSNRTTGSGPSWGAMLVMLAIAILVALVIAYRMIYPFFHPRPH